MLLHHEDLPERRSQRADDPAAATRYQMQHVIADFDVDACILVDEGGQILASDGEVSKELLELATWVPALSKRSPRKPQASMNQRAKNVSVAEFRLHGEKRFMAVIGGQEWKRDVAVVRASLGVRRIHA